MKSPRCSNTTLTDFLESIHFKRNAADTCVFVRMEGGDPTIVAVYVDDLIVLNRHLKNVQNKEKSGRSI